MARKNTILQCDKSCYVCGKQDGLHCHHIYYGRNRKTSDDNGLWCWLCYEHHEGTAGVHGRDGAKLDMALKQACQKAYESSHSHEDFLKLIGRNYL